jgi:hypothetical protein
MHLQAMYSKEVSHPTLALSLLQISASISVIDPRKNQSSRKGAPAAASSQPPPGRIDTIASDAAEVMTSGSYRSPTPPPVADFNRPGFCFCATERLRPGDYIVVLSTFETGAVGPFVLTLATACGSAALTAPTHNKKYFSVKEVPRRPPSSSLSSSPSLQIPPEGYGMQRVSLQGEWKEVSPPCLALLLSTLTE